MKQIKERNLNKNNWMPLHYAAEKNLLNIYQLLFTKGADINAKNIAYYNIVSLI